MPIAVRLFVSSLYISRSACESASLSASAESCRCSVSVSLSLRGNHELNALGTDDGGHVHDHAIDAEKTGLIV